MCCAVGKGVRFDNMEEFVFKFLWIIVLLPKPVQLCCFGVIATVMIRKCNGMCKINRDSVIFSFLLPNILFVIAIISSAIMRSHDIYRIFAAINTCLITFIAVMFYNIYLNVKINYEKISQYMLINFLILCAIWVLYKVLGLQEPSILGRTIGGEDLIYGIQTSRFLAYLEYANLVVYFIIYTFSISIFYVYKHFNKALYLVYCLCPLWIVMATNSRTGFPIAVVISFVAIGVKFFDRIYSYYAKNRFLFLIAMMTLLVVLVILFRASIIDILIDALAKREGSNNTRMTLYILSIRKMLEESPIIGCGIKDLWNNYPYGSHSTFLGMFYKTGILGGVIFLCGMVVTTFNIFKMEIFTKEFFILKMAYYCLILLSILEDLDGTDWNIVLFMIFLAVFKKQSLRNDIELEGKSL